MTLGTMSTLLAAMAVAAASLNAQTTLQGRYALVERGVLSNGQEFVALGTLTIDALGHVTGSQFLRGSGGSADLPLDGSYSSGDSSLSLTYSTTNADGDSMATPLSYRIVGGGASMHAIRSDPGVVSDAQMIPLSSTGLTLNGQYILNETNIESAGQSFVSLTTLTLDGGQAQGRTTRKTFGPEAAYDLAGTFSAGVDGSGTLQLQIPIVNADSGDTSYVTATYRFVAIDAKQLVAVRADAGPVTSVEISAVQ